MDIKTEETEGPASCKFVCNGTSREPQLDPFLVLALFLGSIILNIYQIENSKRKFDKIKKYIHEIKPNISSSPLDHHHDLKTIFDRILNLGSALKEIEDKIVSYPKEYYYKPMLEFPRFVGVGSPPLEWLDRVAQFFKYHGTLENQQVSLASFYLEGEANQWFRWLQRTYKQDELEIIWEVFKKELESRFVADEDEDFGESLSQVKQIGSLRDYRRDFERLRNKMVDLQQQELVEKFMGEQLSRQRLLHIPCRSGAS